MNQKIKFLFLSGLFIQVCFFSNSVYSQSYYAAPYNGGVYNWVSTYTSACSEGISNYYGIYSYVKYADYNTAPSTCATVHTPTVQYYITIPVSKVTCGTDYAPTPSSKSCTFVAPLDCSSKTDTVYGSTFIAATSIDIDGCGYTLGSKVCGSDGFCTGSMTGTGNIASTDAMAFNQIPGSPSLPDILEVPIDNVSNFDTNTSTVDNLDGTFTDTTVDSTSSSNNVKNSVTFDGTTVTVKNDDGTQTSTTTTTVSLINADGSITETSNTSTQISSGSTTINTTNINTGATTSVVSSPLIINNSSGSTRSLDSSGSVTSQTYSDGISTVLEPTDPNNPSDVPSTDSFVNGDYTGLDSPIEALKSFDSSSYVRPSLSIILNTLGTCDNSNFQITVMNTSFAPDICKWIIILQSALYWFFAALTAYYVFHLGTNLGTAS